MGRSGPSAREADRVDGQVAAFAEVSGNMRTASVSVRGCWRNAPGAHGQGQIFTLNLKEFRQVKGHLDRRELAAGKPSAQPTQVRTLDLPPSAKTASGLRVRGQGLVFRVRRRR